MKPGVSGARTTVLPQLRARASAASSVRRLVSRPGPIPTRAMRGGGWNNVRPPPWRRRPPPRRRRAPPSWLLGHGGDGCEFPAHRNGRRRGQLLDDLGREMLPLAPEAASVLGVHALHFLQRQALELALLRAVN